MVDIFINGRFLAQKTSGVQRFAREVITALDKRLAETQRQEQWTLLTPAGVEAVPSLSAIAHRSVGRFSGHLWEQTSLFMAASGGKLVNLCNSGPVLHPRSLTVIHDAMIFRTPKNFSRKYRLVHGALGHLLARRGKIATVSAFSRQELEETIGAKDVSIVSNSCEHMKAIRSDPSVVSRLGLENRPYLLFVGSPTPNKNINRAIEAIGMMGSKAPHFVIVGAAASSVFQAGTHNAHQGPSPVADRVIFTGRLSDEEVAGLYSHASALLFPSLYEGFGIPPLEAMMMGCPVLASDIAPTREVCGDAALYFDPMRPDEMVRAIEEILHEPERRSRMIARGYARSALFSWDQSAKTLMEAIDRL